MDRGRWMSLFGAQAVCEDLVLSDRLFKAYWAQIIRDRV